MLVVLKCRNNLVNLNLKDMVILNHFQEDVFFACASVIEPEALCMFLMPVACNFLGFFQAELYL